MNRAGASAGRVQHQFDVAEDALQRVVQFVCDAGDELSERRQLLGLREPIAQLGPLGLEARLIA